MSSTFPEAAPRLSASRRYFAACACRSAGRLGYGPPNTDTVNTDLSRAFGKRMDLDGVDLQEFQKQMHLTVIINFFVHSQNLEDIAFVFVHQSRGF